MARASSQSQHQLRVISRRPSPTWPETPLCLGARALPQSVGVDVGAGLDAGGVGEPGYCAPVRAVHQSLG